MMEAYHKVLLLNDSEYEIFCMLANGDTHKEIAYKRKRSYKTVESQVATIRKKIGLVDASKLRVYAVRCLDLMNRYGIERVCITRTFDFQCKSVLPEPS